jgi:hypothetical protein
LFERGPTEPTKEGGSFEGDGGSANLADSEILDSTVEAGSTRVDEGSATLLVSTMADDMEAMPFKPYVPEVLTNNPLKAVTVKGNALSFGAITMFAERGFCSGHYYQPPMNHRQVNFIKSLTESHAVPDRMTAPPLIESMVGQEKAQVLALVT